MGLKVDTNHIYMAVINDWYERLKLGIAANFPAPFLSWQTELFPYSNLQDHLGEFMFNKKGAFTFILALPRFFFLILETLWPPCYISENN